MVLPSADADTGGSTGGGSDQEQDQQDDDSSTTSTTQNRTTFGAGEAVAAEPDPVEDDGGGDTDTDADSGTETRTERGARRARESQEDSMAEDAAEETTDQTTDADPRQIQEQVDQRIDDGADTQTRTEQGAAAAVAAQQAGSAEAAAEDLAETRERAEQERERQRREVMRGTASGESALLAAREDELTVRYGEDNIRVGLNESARERVARQQFEVDRDADRLFSGTERVPLGFEEGDFEFEATDDGVVVRPDREAAERVLTQRAAAGSDAFEPGDFTVEETDEGTFTVELSEGARQEQLQAQEEELETASVTVPGMVPVIGGREFSGQVREVDLETTEEGEIDVQEQERFGDFDIPVPVVGGEFEDYTGAAGDRIVSAGETTGDVLARELVEERTVIPGAIVEERLTGDTDFTSEAVRGTAVGAASIGDQALNLPQETVEFGAAAGSAAFSDLQSGEIDETQEFGARFGDAVVGTGIQFGQSAVQNPGRFTGQLAGSAVLTTGAIAGASRFAGPRTARAISVAVQPGEEAAIAAARAGAVPSRVARLVPGVREGHIEGGRVSNETTTEFESEIESESSGLTSGLRERAPRVTVERDADAGFLEINQRSPGEIVRERTPSRSQVSQRARLAGLRTRRRLGDTVTDIQIEAAQLRGRAADAVPSRGDLSAPSPRAAARRGLQTAQLGAMRASRRASDLQTDVAFAATETAARARSAVQRRRQRVGMARSRLSRDIQDFATDVRFEAEQAALRAREFDVSDAVSAPSLDTDVSLPESAFLEAEGTARLDPTQAIPSVGRPSAPSLPSLSAPSFGVGGVSRPSLDVSLPESAFLQAEGTGRFDPTQAAPSVGLPSAPSLLRPSGLSRPSLGTGLSLPESAFLQAEGTGRLDPTRAIPDVSRPSIDGPSIGRPSAGRVRGAVPSPGEVTIRIDTGARPRDVVVDAAALETETETEADDPVIIEIEGEGDASGAGVGSVAGRTEVETDSGVLVQRVRTEFESEAETNLETATEPEVRTETETDSSLRRLQQAETATTPSETVEPIADVGFETTLGPTVETVQEPGVETVSEPGLETAAETRVETRSELTTETTAETRLERRAELTAETRAELRTELDTDPLLRSQRGDDDRRRFGEDFTETFEFGVASPEAVLEGEPFGDDT